MRGLLVIVVALLTACGGTPVQGEDPWDVDPKAGAEKPKAAVDAFAVAAKDLIEQVRVETTIAVARPKLKVEGTWYDWRDVDKRLREKTGHYADYLQAALLRAARQNKVKVEFVTREHISFLLQEQGLQWSNMEPNDPKTRVKLKKIKAVKAYAVWSIRTARRVDISEPSDDKRREWWLLQLLDVETGKVLAASKVIRRDVQDN